MAKLGPRQLLPRLWYHLRHRHCTYSLSSLHLSIPLTRRRQKGDYSLRIEALPDSQVQAEVLGVLRSMYPNITIPDPVAFHFPRWGVRPALPRLVLELAALILQ